MHSERRPCRSKQVWRSGCRAVEKQWKAVVGQRAQAQSTCARIIATAWTETAARGRVPQEDKDAEIAFLPKQGKDIGDVKTWRTISLVSHIGKALAKASVRPLVPAVGKVTGPCNFGSLPGRSTGDAIAAASSQVSCSTWRRKQLTPSRGIDCGQRSQMPRS